MGGGGCRTKFSEIVCVNAPVVCIFVRRAAAKFLKSAPAGGSSALLGGRLGGRFWLAKHKTLACFFKAQKFICLLDV